MKKQNKIDLEAKLFILLLNLKEEKNKEYSLMECDKNIVYLFNDYDEFRTYFEVNGYGNIDYSIMEICIMKITNKGTIVALKALCDYAIRIHNSKYLDMSDSLNLEKQNFEVLAVPCDRAFVVSKEKTKEFKKSKNSKTIKSRVEIMDKNIHNNDNVQEDMILKKIRKKSK